MRDTFLRLGSTPFEVFRPVWSTEILAELRRNLCAKTGAEPSRVDAMLARFDDAFPNARIDPDPAVVAKMPNHAKDRHVLAVAVTAGAHLVVTANVRDFGRAQWLGVQIQTPDDFLCALHDEQPETIRAAMAAQVANLTNPPVTVDDLITRLPAVGLPKLAARLRSRP